MDVCLLFQDFDDGVIVVVEALKKPDVGDLRWITLFAGRDLACTHLEGVGLLKPIAAEATRRNDPLVTYMPAQLQDAKRQLSAFQPFPLTPWH